MHRYNDSVTENFSCFSHASVLINVYMHLISSHKYVYVGPTVCVKKGVNFEEWKAAFWICDSLTSLHTFYPLSPSIRVRLENYPWSNSEKNLCEIFFSSCLLHSCHVGASVSRGHLHMAHNHLVLSVWATVTLHQDINMAVRYIAYFIKLLPE